MLGEFGMWGEEGGGKEGHFPARITVKSFVNQLFLYNIHLFMEYY